MQKVFSPKGQPFTILPDGRKMDEDGFVCSSKTPGQKEGAWFCVAVKMMDDGVLVRDTKDPSKSTLRYTRDEWKAFVEGVKAGEFDT